MLSIADVAKVFSQLIGTTDMGARVNGWLFSLLFGLLILAISGSNLGAVGGQLISILKNTPGVVGDVVSSITGLFNGEGNPPPLPIVGSPMNPLPGQNWFNSVPLPTWIFMMGVFIWATMVLWEVLAILQGGKSLRERSWEWTIAPVTLLAFIIAPEFGTILDTGLYTPIMTHLIVGAQETMKIKGTVIDPATFGNPLWLLANMFGIGNPNGGVNSWAVLGNGLPSLVSGLADLYKGIAGATPWVIVGSVFQHLLSPSIVIEVIILSEAIILTLQGTLMLLFFSAYPVFSLAIVGNPFSLDRIVQFLKVSLQVMCGVALIMFTHIVIALINYQITGSKNVAALFFGGWVLSVLNIIILAVAIWLVSYVGIAPLRGLVYSMAKEVKVTGGRLQHAFDQNSGHLPSRIKDTFNNDYKGDFKNRTIQRALDIVNPDEMERRVERETPKPYEINAYDYNYERKAPDGTVETINQEKKSISFNNKESAEWVWKLLRNEGNINKAWADRGDALPEGSVGAGFELDNSKTTIRFLNEDRPNKVLSLVLGKTKVYRYSKGKYINNEGTIVPESEARKGIIA